MNRLRLVVFLLAPVLGFFGAWGWRSMTQSDAQDEIPEMSQPVTLDNLFVVEDAPTQKPQPLTTGTWADAGVADGGVTGTWADAGVDKDYRIYLYDGTLYVGMRCVESVKTEGDVLRVKIKPSCLGVSED